MEKSYRVPVLDFFMSVCVFLLLFMIICLYLLYVIGTELVEE